MIALIDGDIVVFRAGFAANSEPLSHNLHNVNLIIKDILGATKADDYQIYLKGSGNYRESIASTTKYKGNRNPAHRPVHEASIREYLVDTWKAKLVDGMESDDALGIAQTGYAPYEDSVICSIDKDLLMVPGGHYNFVKKKFYTVSEQEGMVRFLRQLIEGDRADNVIGIPKYGPVAAKRLIKDDTPYKEGWDTVQELYSRLSTPETLWANARLLWVCRTEADDFLLHHGDWYVSR